ncbi:hypothetical protein J1605_008349 [Eschrichtius robustus]|uniref:60S ribosomal protein L10-like n=1 Tax=Eschrichtius robustus TaxID=9764 RepID=A0AB34GXZ5_ESCRO|nr:hypothetical protein J1605_008349 [Eschrichtius robustus]
MSIGTKLQNKGRVIEAKFKFPGCQKIHISKKWGFTKFNADEFENMVAEKQPIPDACEVKYIPSCVPLAKWQALHSREAWHCALLTHAHQEILLSYQKKKKKEKKNASNQETPEV